jgi:predicted O-methyltransferase YrrM
LLAHLARQLCVRPPISYVAVIAMTNTLTGDPVASVLTRLFADAKQSGAVLDSMFTAMTPEERTRRMTDRGPDYVAFYGNAREIHMPVSPETGRLLYMLVRSTRAKVVVEFGTSFGISTIHLAAGLRDNGGGRLIGSDLETTKIAHARANLAEAGLADLVEIREGDALQTLARDLPDAIDVVLLDGHKPLYSDVLALLEPRMRAGTCIVADNADWCPPYLARVRDSANGYMSTPFNENVELTIKL